MIELKDCIPTMEELTRRGEALENQKASATAVLAMTETLVMNGYTKENPEVFDVIARYGAAEIERLNSRGLFLKGGCGIGKSYGVACLAAYFQWPILPAKLLQTAYMSAENDEDFWKLVDALDFFGRPMTIVIDDLGTEDLPLMKYGTATNLMADVLDRRYYTGFLRHGVRTIVTSNLTDAQLRDRYGLRIDDRMNEMFEFATVEGRSLRK